MQIEQLDKKKHIRKSFFCGIPALDTYLKERASQDLQRYIAVTYVLCDDESTIAGFYSLSSTSIDTGILPEDVVRKLPKYPHLPATLIGRLAVDQRYQGQGLGEYLLMDALHRSYQQSHRIAATAVIVDLKNKDARSFYGKYGFITLPDQPERMFITMSTVSKMFL
ncbi:MAG: GNAT family N-acetyltransferase [Desulfovermiculus sp.]|nr:GNAT family N-acetyltransferase [Desulfovermiculus sp.]